jgi:hypothetical protein
MTEPEVLFPVRCPICLQESLAGFRVSVVAEALQTLEIRLYASCHVASWHASERELAQIRQYLGAYFPYEDSHEPRPREVAVSR